jgi:hypothetical protein
MPITVTCPYCGEETLADDRFAGREGPCVNCGRTITIPADAPHVEIQPAPRLVAAPERFKFVLVSIASVSAVATILLVGLFLVRPAMTAAQLVAKRHTCAANIQTLGVALLQYQQEHGQFPPACTYGPDGKPWHSWRVLILPYVGKEGEELYRLYDMNQPWNSPYNMSLLPRMPRFYASPGDPSAATMYETNYLAVVGSEMIFQNGRSLGTSDVTDGLQDTILLVEAKSTSIPWTEPRDLNAAQLSYQVGVDVGGNHPGGMNVATADGEPHFLPDSTPSETLHELLTARGGEQTLIDEDR